MHSLVLFFKVSVTFSTFHAHAKPCRLNITRRVTYQKTLKLGRDRPGAIFLEIGAGCECGKYSTDYCGLTPAIVGTDSRKLVSDGFPVENVVINDLHDGKLI